MQIDASPSFESGSTYFRALSFRYVIASSAPKARNARAQPQAMELSLAMPTIRPLRPSRSLAFTVGSGMSDLRWLCATDNRDRVARDHQFLVCRNDEDRKTAGPCGNDRGAFFVCAFVDLGAEPPQPLDDERSDFGRVLADARREHERVDAVD